MEGQGLHPAARGPLDDLQALYPAEVARRHAEMRRETGTRHGVEVGGGPHYGPAVTGGRGAVVGAVRPLIRYRSEVRSRWTIHHFLDRSGPTTTRGMIVRPDGTPFEEQDLPCRAAHGPRGLVALHGHAAVGLVIHTAEQVEAPVDLSPKLGDRVGARRHGLRRHSRQLVRPPRADLERNDAQKVVLQRQYIDHADSAVVHHPEFRRSTIWSPGQIQRRVCPRWTDMHGRDSGRGLRKISFQAQHRSVRTRDQGSTRCHVTRRLTRQSILEPQSARRGKVDALPVHRDADADHRPAAPARGGLARVNCLGKDGGCDRRIEA